MDGVIPRYTVPVSGGGHRGCDPATALLLALIVVLVIVIACAAWRRRYRAKPHCGQYRHGPARTCAKLSQMCGPDAPCLNAVAHCMPLLDKMSSAHVSIPPNPNALADALSGPELKECTRAVAAMDPQFVANLAVKYGGAQACVPPAYASLLADPSGQRAMMNVFEAVAPLVPYSLAVAQALPACPPTRRR
jgi:hypothetical protein